MTKDEKAFIVLGSLLFLAPFIALAIWLDWSIGTTISIICDVCLLIGIRGVK